MNLPANVAAAIRCGPPFNYRDWRSLAREELTDAELAMRFVEAALKIPDGPHVGEPMTLDAFQEALFYQVIDTGIWQLLLSMGRKNAKTATTAALLLAYVVGPLGRQNDELASAANSRDQAAHIFGFMSKMLALNPDLIGRYRLVPSYKTIVGTSRNVTFRALSSEAKNAHGGNYRVIVVDELGQVAGQTDKFFDALVTGQGGQDDPKLVVISTQAPSDSALFSTLIDTAIANDSTECAVHLYTADPDCALDDYEQWAKSNPALGRFRSLVDIQRQAKDALALPSAASRFRNLILNQRVSAEALFLSPDAWKRNNKPPSLDLMRARGVQIGLDLSQKVDLTACVLAAVDDDKDLHLITHAFAPKAGLEARSVRDRVPYVEWARMGLLNTPDGEIVDYDAVCAYLAQWLKANGIAVNRVAFDRWRIADFRKAAERWGFAMEAEWIEVGQGFKDMSPRVESFEAAVLSNRIRHGSHPVLNMGAACAVVVTDPAGGRKLDKSRASQRIDALVAALMASHELLVGEQATTDVSHWIA